MVHQSGLKLPSCSTVVKHWPQKLQRFCENKTGMVDIASGCPWDNVYAPSTIEPCCGSPPSAMAASWSLKRSLNPAVPQVQLADGVRLVPFDMSMDEALRATHNEVFLDHWGSTPKDEESWTIEVTGARAFRGGSSYLVLDGETIAAHVLGYECDADTAVTGIKELYIGHLGTRRSHRGRGLARAALAKVLTEAFLETEQRARLPST